MHKTSLPAHCARVAALAVAIAGLSLSANAQYAQTNLVSNIPGLATITDPLLVNPWGISRSPTSPFWTSNQGTNTSTLYAVTGSTNVSQVTAVNANGFVGFRLPQRPQGPTGQVNNTNTASFHSCPATPDVLPVHLRRSERYDFGLGGRQHVDGRGDESRPVYTGLAINTAGTRLYAANGTAGPHQCV